jgi:tetratricopeptide (TPR) repeat protein
LLVLLYDRTFVAGTFRAAWRQRWRLYLGLGSTWLLLAYLMMGTNHRGGACGFGLGVSWWEYALKQCQAIVHYLWLCFWPHPLIFDYGMEVVKWPGAVVPQALVLIILVAGTLVGLWRWPMVSFVGIWFFAILAPSSSVVPIKMQTMAEHRMYLPLAGVITLSVLGLYRLAGRGSMVACLALATGLVALTVQRNKVYQSALAIWSNTVANCPDNIRARYNLGNALGKIPDRRLEAIAEYEAALRIDPGYLAARINLAYILSGFPDRWPEAIAQYETVLRSAPDNATAHNNLANMLLNIPGRLPDAIAQYEAALRAKPDYVEARVNLGNVFASIPGRLPEAIAQYKAALRIKPDFKAAQQMLEAAEKTQAKNNRDQPK